MITDEDVDEFLAHYGVRGMKWGQRKATISKARQQTIETIIPNKHKELRKISEGSGTRAEKRSARKQVNKDYRNNETVRTAITMTRGEQVAATLLAGPIGLTYVAALSISNRDSKRKLVK